MYTMIFTTSVFMTCFCSLYLKIRIFKVIDCPKPLQLNVFVKKNSPAYLYIVKALVGVKLKKQLILIIQLNMFLANSGVTSFLLPRTGSYPNPISQYLRVRVQQTVVLLNC